MAETTKTKKPRAKNSELLTPEEQAAMKEHLADMKRAKSGKVDGEQDIHDKIADMGAEDQAIANRVHAIIRKAAPGLQPKTWYGMPAYARDDKVVVFFQPAGKFKARYSTLGFNDPAKLDDGKMWATGFALTEIDDATEKRIADLVKRAAG